MVATTFSPLLVLLEAPSSPHAAAPNGVAAVVPGCQLFIAAAGHGFLKIETIEKGNAGFLSLDQWLHKDHTQRLLPFAAGQSRCHALQCFRIFFPVAHNQR